MKNNPLTTQKQPLTFLMFTFSLFFLILKLSKEKYVTPSQMQRNFQFLINLCLARCIAGIKIEISNTSYANYQISVSNNSSIDQYADISIFMIATY